MNIPDDGNEGFFRYNWFISHLQEISREWDSIVIIPQSKIIINIEVKSGQGFYALKKAASQTKTHLTIFKRIFGASLSVEWKFVKAVCTQILESNQPCETCQEFILEQVDFLDIKPWIKNLMSTSSKYVEEIYETEYENLLVAIIGFSSLRQSEHLNKLILNPKELGKDTERILTAQESFIHGENEDDRDKLRDSYEVKNYKSNYLCYMLTPNQLLAVKDPSSHIIIEGDYGCGKTYVLKERTKQCADRYPECKIAYVSFTGNSNRADHRNFMDMIAENDFKNYKNVDVVTRNKLYYHSIKYEKKLKINKRVKLGLIRFGDEGEEFSVLLRHFIKHYNYDHIFVDEMPPFKKKVNSKYDFFTPDKTYCVTVKCTDNEHNENNMNKEWIIQMKREYNAKRILLKHNLRNSETVANLSTCFDQRPNVKLVKASVIPNKNIIGPNCYHYYNTHKLEEAMLARAAILKYFPQIHEPVLVLVATTFNFNETHHFYQLLKTYFSTDRNILYFEPESNFALNTASGQSDYEKHVREVKEYLKKPEGILVTNITTFGGAQARNIIIIADDTRKVRSEYLRNMIMRTMSFVIIIYAEDIEESVPGLVRDIDLHEYIYPGKTEQLFCNNKDDEHRSSCNLPLAVFTNQIDDLAKMYNEANLIREETEMKKSPEKNYRRNHCCNLL